MARVTVSPTKKPIRGVHPGGRLTVSNLEARVLVALHRAVIVPDEPPPPAVPEKLEPRKYKRRDLTAEDQD